jgi:hypothetical protein
MTQKTCPQKVLNFSHFCISCLFLVRKEYNCLTFSFVFNLKKPTAFVSKIGMLNASTFTRMASLNCSAWISCVGGRMGWGSGLDCTGRGDWEGNLCLKSICWVIQGFHLVLSKVIFFRDGG